MFYIERKGKMNKLNRREICPTNQDAIENLVPPNGMESQSNRPKNDRLKS